MSQKLSTLLCFFAFLIFYGITSRADLQITDEVAVFASAISLAEEGDLSIDELSWLNDRVNIGDTGRGGYLYAKYFPGNIISAAAVYRLTRQADLPYEWRIPNDIDAGFGRMTLALSEAGARNALKLNAILGAWAMAMLFHLLIQRFDWKTSLTTVLVVGIGTDWWYQSRGFMSEIGAGALLITSLYYAEKDSPHLSGLALGISILFRPVNLIAFPIWLKSAWDKKVLWSVWGIFLGVIGLALFNWIRFESFFKFGYQEESFLLHLIDGLYGVLLSPGRSIFLYSPILTLAIPGAWLLYKHKNEKMLTIVVSSTSIFYILVAASWHSWDGGWSWGSRLLTPILPILGFLSAPAIEFAWRRKGDIAVVFVLALLGIVIQLAALAVNPLVNLVNAVVYGGVEYNETVNSIGNSWLALQLQSLRDWQVCSLDAYTIRQWIGVCGY